VPLTVPLDPDRRISKMVCRRGLHRHPQHVPDQVRGSRAHVPGDVVASAAPSIWFASAPLRSITVRSTGDGSRPLVFVGLPLRHNRRPFVESWLHIHRGVR
jgi:hypothetical protein